MLQKYYEDCFARIERQDGRHQCKALDDIYCEKHTSEKCPFYQSMLERKRRDRKYGGRNI